MKFAEHLSAHLTPEWRKQYIEYEALKAILYKALDDFEELPVVDAVTVGEHFDECDTVFFAMCQAELDKINNFFAEKLAESKRKFAAIKDECDRHFPTRRRAPIASLYLNSPAAVIENEPARDASVYRNAERPLEYTHSSVHRINDMDMLRRRRNTFRLKKDEKRFVHASRQVGQNEETPRLKIYDLKLALSEFYLSLVLLQNYQSLNFTGFRKILKKHDKLFQRSNGLEWYRNTVSAEPFHIDDSVDAMIAEVEETFTKLEGGNRQKAMKRLRVPPLAAQASGKSIFRFGLFFGIFLSEILCIILVAVFAKLPQFSYPAFRLFRGSFLVIYYVCMVGVNVYGWRSSGVNHVLIFEIDPRSHLNQFQLMEMGMFLADFWGAAVLLYQFSDLIHFPGYVTPLVLFTTMLVFLLLPFHIFYFKSRLWLLKILFRIIRAPLARVRFPDFFLADQLNSLSFILPDFAYFLCFFINFIDDHMMIKSSLRNSTIPPPGASRLFVPKAGFCDGMMWGLQPILKALPAWWRFLQCLRRYRDLTIKSPVPHLMNAGKYSTTLIAIVCSVISSINHHTAFFVLMILSKLCSSICTTTWDLVMDWGLMDCSSKENVLLRDELVYRFRAYYYGAILEDVIIRFAWILPLVFSHFRIVDVEIITTIVMFAEVTRRIIWNFFRLENEHLNNCGNFRAVRDIGIAPIRKETSPHPITQEGDKAFGMFNQLYTLNQNDNSSRGSNNNRSIEENNQGFDEGGSNGTVGGIAMENAPLPTTLADYAMFLQQNNRKSLWNHLRNAYLQTKKEKRRRLDFDRIVSMEEALRAAQMNVQSKSGSATLTPRGATPTRDPGKVHAQLCEKVQQPSSTTTAQSAPTITQQPENILSLQPPPLSQSLPKTAPRPSKSARSRSIAVDGRQRRAFAKPQQSALVKNRASARLTPAYSVGDLCGFHANAPGISPPHSEEANINCGPDPAITPEMLSQTHSDDSPGDTVLPIRTSLLANRLRELLNTFSSGHFTATPSSSVPMVASGGASRPKRWQYDAARGHRTVNAQTTQHGRFSKEEEDEVKGRGGLVSGRSGHSRDAVRRRSISALKPSVLDSSEGTRNAPMDLNSSPLVEDTEDVGQAQLRGNQNPQTSSRNPSSIYPTKFTVEPTEHLDEVARF